MEFELRTVLLLIGVVFIKAILIHGFIGIRKANKPIDLSGIDLSEEDDKGNLLRDGSGFDRHGVGVARVIEDDEHAENLDLPPLLSDEPIIDFDLELNIEPSEPTMDVEPEVVAPAFASPIFKEKPVVEKLFTEEIKINEPVIDEIQETKAPQQPLDVLVLNVIAGDDDELNGAQLLPLLLTLGFKFGDMDIFHRHVSSDGHGEVLFSLANMVKPGVFDIDNMAQFSTTGISLFMTIPHNNGNLATFNMMLNAAAKIAEEFSGQVLDGERSTLTKQSTQHYVSRIRDVEHKLLLKK